MNHLKQNQLKKQAGLSTLGLIFFISILSFLILASFKVGPMYIDFYQVESIVESVSEDQNVNIKSPKELWIAINKRLKINNINYLGKNDIQISRDSNRRMTQFKIKYERRENFIANIFVGVSFDKTIEISR